MLKAKQLWEGRRTWGKRTPVVKILSVEFLPPGPVIAIETSTKTYISEGFFSHNCAIEAVLVGWFARSPSYITLAKLGVHSGLASHILGKPYSPEWSTTKLKAYLADIKLEAQATPSGSSDLYDVSKRVVHGSAYCLTPHGMVNNFPKQFKTHASAKKYQDIYFTMAPDVPAWQKSVQRFAYDHGYLGGPGDPPFGHPFAYKHWFWAVAQYRKITKAQASKREAKGYAVAWFHGVPYAVDLGEDAKRAVAFFPQSTGRGILTEAMLRLFDPEEAEPYDSYIGDAYYGATPLRAPIHDSLFMELPRRISDRVLEIVYREMTRPIVQMPMPAAWGLGECLSIDVEVKVGQSWDAMEKIKAIGVEQESYFPSLAEEEEEVAALQTEVA